jgi:hypothetical protein
MDDERMVREKAREVIRSGKLPDRRPDRMWGGAAARADCAICGAPLRPDEVEFEIEFVRNGEGSGADRYHLHTRCFAAWELERHNRGAGTDTS